MTLELSGEGALQITSATKTTGDFSLEDVRHYADSQNDNWGTPEPTICGEFIGFKYQYRDREMQCNRWFLTRNSTLLLVTYFGTPRGQLTEYAAVEKMLTTLQAESAA